MKRLISALLLISILLSLLPASVFAIAAIAQEPDGSVPALEPLYSHIAVLPGQLDPVSCEVLESEIYGYVVNHELKKGHTLSISDTNYVFSVRKLVNRNYSTMLKQATNASFTASEDMTVAMLVRKPDKSAVTDDELAGITVTDSIYGMAGVEGFVHRFTVEAQTIDGGTATTRAAIFLPDSYSADGEPTRLIVMTNGHSAYLTDSVWNGNTADNVGIIRSYLDAGYAVYVVNNTKNHTGKTPDLGCPQLVSSYLKAYEYIQERFNVEEKMSVHSRSFGTFAALRLMREAPELINCGIMTGPRVSIKKEWPGLDKAFIANRFGFEDTTGATYEADKMVGHDPYTDVDGESYALPPTYWVMCEGDATDRPLEFIEKLKGHGNEVSSVTWTGTTHTGVCTLNTEEMFADALEFLEEKAHTHSYTATVTPPTCTGQGYTTYTCECGDSYVEEYVAAVGHGYDNNICTVCGAAQWDTDGDGVLEILAIGNSFSVDALEYAYQIAQNLSIEKIVIGNLYIGGCSLNTHVTNAAGDLAKYTYYYNDNGTWTSTKNYKINTALDSRSWDYISMQQASSYSGVESTYNEDLTNLISYVKDHSDAKLVWHMTWAYQQNSTHSAFPTYGKNQMTMYNAIVSAVQNKIVTNSAFDLIVPNGTAVQNSRTSLLGDTTTRDGYHMSKDYGRYLTGLMFIKTVTGLSVDNITYAPSGVDAKEMAIAIESVNNAYANPFTATVSIYATVVPEEGYILLQQELYKGAFWYPINADRYNEPVYDMSNSHQYFATIRFTRETLPVGSIIVLADGWQYRPDGWVTDAVQTGKRELVTTEPYVVVTEEWWGDYTIRGFNISKVGLPSLENVTEEEVRTAFQIYIPEASHNHSYTNGICTVCRKDSAKIVRADGKLNVEIEGLQPGATVTAAFYDASGRMLACRIAAADTNALSFDDVAGAQVKVFVTDSSWKPLRPEITLPD